MSNGPRKMHKTISLLQLRRTTRSKRRRGTNSWKFERKGKRIEHPVSRQIRPLAAIASGAPYRMAIGLRWHGHNDADDADGPERGLLDHGSPGATRKRRDDQWASVPCLDFRGDLAIPCLTSPLNRAFRAKPRFMRNRPILHSTQDRSGLFANICRSSILGDTWSQVRLFSRHSITTCGAKSFVENSKSD
jgi:hypothetical protein